MPTSMNAKDERKRPASSIASASAAIRRVRLNSPVSGSSCESFRSCSFRAWRSLLMRMIPCARDGLPSAPANQRPHSSTQSTGDDVLARKPYSIWYGTPSPLSVAVEFSTASLRMARIGSISFENSLAFDNDACGMSRSTAATFSLQCSVSPAMLQEKLACPRAARKSASEVRRTLCKKGVSPGAIAGPGSGIA